jgi:hypothetical protein
MRELEYEVLLPNTKLTEDEVQLVFIADLSCDFTEVVQTLSDINSQ